MAASATGRDVSMSPSRSPARSRGRSPSQSRSRSPSPSRTRAPKKDLSRSASPIGAEELGDRGAQNSNSGEDKTETSPFLIRVFARQGPGFHPVDDFDDGLWPLKEEYGVWAWKSSNLNHITSLIHPSLPTILRSPLARYTYKLLYVDTSQNDLRDAGRGGGPRFGQGPGGRGYKGIYRVKEMGQGVMGRDLFQPDDRPSGNGLKSLQDLRFQPGDHLLLSITLPPGAFPSSGPVPGLPGNPIGRNGMSIAGAAGARAGPGGLGGLPGGQGSFSVFGASARGGLAGGALGRGGRSGPHDLLEGGLGAPENGSWKEAREANPGLRGSEFRSTRERGDDRQPARGEGSGGWRGRATASGAYKTRSPARIDDGQGQSNRTDAIRPRRERSGSPARDRTRNRSRSTSPAEDRAPLRSRGPRRGSPEYN